MSKPVKCACGGEECKIQINLVEEGLWFVDKDGDETLMYLDPNTIVALIHELRKLLIRMTNEYVDL